MGRITINGQTFVGSSITIRNGSVVIDGVAQNGTVSGVVEVRVLEGAIGRLETDGSVTCGAVTGSVSAGGSVRCDAVGGNVSAGGSVTCDEVGGAISAGGSVRVSK